MITNITNVVLSKSVLLN